MWCEQLAKKTQEANNCGNTSELHELTKQLSRKMGQPNMVINWIAVKPLNSSEDQHLIDDDSIWTT